MESSTLRFLAVSIAVVLLFSCATLDDELHDIHDIAADSIEHESDGGTVDPELSDPEGETSPMPDPPELPVDIAAVADDALPRLIPSLAEPPVPTAALPVPEPPIAESESEPAFGDDPAPEEPALRELPAPENVSTLVPAGETDADTAVPPVSEPVSEPAPPISAVPSEPRRVEDEPVEGPVQRASAVPAASDPREIETDVMTELSVVFRGFGWVYAGAESTGNGRVEFLRSGRTGDSTIFVFRMTESGRYTLSFQRQDLTRGEFVDETVAVTAREDQPLVETAEDSPAADRPAGGAVETGEETAPTVRAESPDSTPGLVSPTRDIDPRVAFDNALREGDAERAVAAIREIPIEGVSGADAARLARLLDRNGDVVGAIEFYELAVARGPLGSDMAEILFALGTLYERESDRRSIRRSHGYYQRLVTEYPFSRLRDDARRRAAYLERYFLTVR